MVVRKICFQKLKIGRERIGQRTKFIDIVKRIISLQALVKPFSVYLLVESVAVGVKKFFIRVRYLSVIRIQNKNMINRLEGLFSSLQLAFTMYLSNRYTYIFIQLVVSSTAVQRLSLSTATFPYPGHAPTRQPESSRNLMPVEISLDAQSLGLFDFTVQLVTTSLT